MGVDTAGRKRGWTEPLLQAETKIEMAIQGTTIQDTKREQGYETDIANCLPGCLINKPESVDENKLLDKPSATGDQDSKG
jgi:hypothetical protein